METSHPVAIVTGGGRNLGKAIALRLARDGHDVVLAGPEREALDGTAADVVALGHRALSVVTDVSREDQVTAANAHALSCRLVVEGANGPTSIEGDAILAERGIPVLPDVLTNAGGVTVSYFEWVQDLSRLFWDRGEIRRRLAEKLGDAFDRVWALSETEGVSLRSAALISGIRDVAAALEARGIYP